MIMSMFFLIVEVLNQLLEGFAETELSTGFSLELFFVSCN